MKKLVKVVTTFMLALSIATLSGVTTPVKAATTSSIHTGCAIAIFELDRGSVVLGQVMVDYAYDDKGNGNIVRFYNVSAPSGWTYTGGSISSNGQELKLNFKANGANYTTSVYIYYSSIRK